MRNEFTEMGLAFLFILIGLWCLYMAVYWGSMFFNLCLKYLYDGEKESWTLQSFIDRNKRYKGGDEALDGFLWPLIAVMVIGAIALVIDMTGDIVPIAFICLSILYGLLRIARAVIRLKKKLDIHIEDKQAHK